MEDKLIETDYVQTRGVLSQIDFPREATGVMVDKRVNFRFRLRHLFTNIDPSCEIASYDTLGMYESKTNKIETPSLFWHKRQDDAAGVFRAGVNLVSALVALLLRSWHRPCRKLRNAREMSADLD